MAKKLGDLLKEHKNSQEEWQESIPFDVWRIFSGKKSSIRFLGDQVCLGEEADYVSVEELKSGLEWWVDQIGGKIEWERN